MDSSGLYIPTFGEMMLNEYADRMRESTKDHSSMMIPLINRLNEVSIEYGSNSAHLAILGLRLSNGGESSESLHELFTEQAAASAITYLMENQITNMSDSRFLNLLSGAKDLDVNLDTLCVRGYRRETFHILTANIKKRTIRQVRCCVSEAISSLLIKKPRSSYF